MGTRIRYDYAEHSTFRTANKLFNMAQCMVLKNVAKKTNCFPKTSKPTPINSSILCKIYIILSMFVFLLLCSLAVAAPDLGPLYVFSRAQDALE